MFCDNFNTRTFNEDSEIIDIDAAFGRALTGGGMTVINRRSSGVNIKVKNCRFINNSANNDSISSATPILLRKYGHGGGLLIRWIKVSESNVMIEDSLFQDNRAQVDGAGIFISLSNTSINNNLTIRNTTIENNNVEDSGGGGVSLNSFQVTHSNNFRIEDCIFANNSASAGGAFSLILYQRDAEMEDQLIFINCSFIRNTAVNDGTAVGLFSLLHVDEVGFPVEFENW